MQTKKPEAYEKQGSLSEFLVSQPEEATVAHKTVLGLTSTIFWFLKIFKWCDVNADAFSLGLLSVSLYYQRQFISILEVYLVWKHRSV